MTIGQLRYDQVAFKGVHNSIDRKYSVLEQLKATGGVVGRCAAIELDLHQNEVRFEWSIKHGTGDPGTPFEDMIRDIAGWSRQNPKHSVVTIHLDLKNQPLSHTGFAKALDALLIKVFGERRIYAPGAVIGPHEDLVRGATAGGWKTLDGLEGKIVFCLSGKAIRKQTYAATQPRSRMCFADFSGSRGPSRKGYRIFANLFVDAHRYRESLNRLAARAGFITRGYNIVTARNWQRSIDGGLNILSSDILDKANYSLGGTGRKALSVARHVKV